MKLEEIKEYSKEAERELIDWDNTLEVPHGGHSTGKWFKLEDVKRCFSKVFAIRELVSLVGSVAIHGEGNDVDLVLAIADLPEDLQTAINFRLYRAFAGYFNIPYDETPKYLHLHTKEVGQSPFTSWIPLYKLALVPTSDGERRVHKMSLDSDNDERFVILSKERRIIAGTITTDSIDLQGERISPKALEHIWKHIEELPEEYLNCMYRHTSIQVGKMLKSYRNRKSAFMGDSIYVICELRHDLPQADMLWEQILANPDAWGFSIKITVPEPLRKNLKQVCEGDLCFTEIEDAMFIEFSITDNPANPDCKGIEVLSK